MTLIRHSLAFYLYLLGTLISLPVSAGETRLPLWSRDISFHPLDGYTSAHRFSLRSITQEGLHLTGECAFYQTKDKEATTVSIAGTKTADGEFWPDIFCEVKDSENGTWTRISMPFDHGHRGEVLIKPGEQNTKLFVSLDVFFPLVETHKLGRIVLATGDVAEFELSSLLEYPPKADQN